MDEKKKVRVKASFIPLLSYTKYMDIFSIQIELKYICLFLQTLCKCAFIIFNKYTYKKIMRIHGKLIKAIVLVTIIGVMCKKC